MLIPIALVIYCFATAVHAATVDSSFSSSTTSNLSSNRNCAFASSYSCDDFQNEENVASYLRHVMRWEGEFAQPNVGYDAITGHTLDGQTLDYDTGRLFNAPHMFSAPSKESIHLAMLALAVSGNKYAIEFGRSKAAVLELLKIKIRGYQQFNKSYPGFGCFTPWVGFNITAGTIEPLADWAHKVPGLDNGEWHWALYATALALEEAGEIDLAQQYRAHVVCQRASAKAIFYRGEGMVSAVATVTDTALPPAANVYPNPNYAQESGYLNDPYEGELMTQLLYLFGEFASEEEREMLWIQKRGLFQAVNYTIPASVSGTGAAEVITVQKGYWFSTHEQWKLLLMPYLAPELPVVMHVFRNAEVVRSWDAFLESQPGMLASVNDVTDGSETIDDYISAAGVAAPGLTFETVVRRDVVTPYGAYALLLQDRPLGLCWYNNMLSAPRMQGYFGSTEAINVNGTEISPLVTWDSKITSVLAMLGGVGHLVRQGLETELPSATDVDIIGADHNLIHSNGNGNSNSNSNSTAFDKFVAVLNREHELVFGAGPIAGAGFPIHAPGLGHQVPSDQLSPWDLKC